MDIIYIIYEDDNIIKGVYKDLNIALSVVLDYYLLQMNVINKLTNNNTIIMSNIFNYKIIAHLVDSNIISNQIYFCLKKFIFYDSNNKSNYLIDNLFTAKIKDIKTLYNKFMEYSTTNNLDVFIPNININKNN